MTATSRFETVLQELEQEYHLLRIKKLLVYACYNRWESHEARLSTFSTRTLLQALLETEPNLEQLTNYLHHVAQTLNKSAEYTLVANIIIRHLEKLYVPVQRSPKPEISTKQSIKCYLETAHHLEQDQDALRIKKLLFAACGYAWENDPIRLQKIKTSALIQKLHQSIPNIVNLEAVLRSIVQTLNRQYEYTIVAHKIIQAVSHWYDQAASRPPIQPAANQLLDQPSNKLPNKPSDRSKPAAKSISSASVNKPVRVEISASGRFDLRLEIMKYTNPWKTKLLLVSALHSPLNDTLVALNTLTKTDELDDLLQMLFKMYPSFDRVMDQLNQTARQLRPVEDYLQTVSAIARAIQPYYQSGRSPLASQAQPTKPAVPAQPEPTPQVPEPEHTCQFLIAESGDRTAPTSAQPAGIPNTSEQAYQSFLTAVRSLFGEQS